jgi:hypothetical protein
VIADQVSEHTNLKTGADINWKPSSQFWLTATLNPDFGQVESDELVVDFSAIETLFTDKRPFFTENQAIFDLRTPANGQLIYTRRIGAASDDRRAAATDIDAGLKLTGTASRLVYGAFAAQEEDYDDAGRLFAATRLALPFDQARVGHLATFTQRPLLEREALINALDFEITPNESWRVAAQAVRSDIAVADVDRNGYLAWMQLDMNRAAPLTHTLKLLHVDDRFDLNDMGYMERNSLRQGEWETNRRIGGKQNERISGEDQRLYFQYRQNTQGQHLPSRVQVSRDIHYASSWRAYQELRFLPGGIDDLISRGNGPVRIQDRYAAYFDVSTPRLDDWTHTFGAYVFQQGVEDLSAYVQWQAAWYPVEQLSIRGIVRPQWSDDWLLWARDTLFGAYDAERLDLDLRLDWIPSLRHELRIKLQWIGIHAEPRRAFRSDVAGRLLQTSDRLRPFTVNNFGLQIRYRYEIAPMSEVFVVYSRGGFDFAMEDEREVSTLLRHVGDVRDAEQILVKVRYRL